MLVWAFRRSPYSSSITPSLTHRVVAAPNACAACRISSDVLVLVDRAELRDIPELLAAFVENVMDGQPISTVAVTPGGQPPKLGRPATQSVPSNCWMPLPRRSAPSAKFTVR